MPHFPLVQHALVTPTRCLTCQTNQCHEGFLDTLVEIPGYGRVYLCGSCVAQGATQIGYLAPSVAGEYRDRIASLEVEARELRAELARAEGRGSWTFAPSPDGLTPDQWERVGEVIAETEKNLVCPDCGGPKGPTSKRCRDCHTKTLHGATAA